MFSFLILLLANCGCALDLNDQPKPCCQEAVTTYPNLTEGSWEEVCGEGEDSFNKHLLYLLDHQQNAFLMRGNLPEDKMGFEYDELVQSIKEYLAEIKVPISDSFKIMDVSFLNYFTEGKQIEIEKSWFEKNPDKGCFWPYSLYGSLVNPVDLPQPVREFWISHEDVDGQKSLIRSLQTLVAAPCSSDIVYYMHCHAGKDRTGECSTNYLMAKGFSYKDGVALAEKIAGRKLRDLSMNAIRWYAFYLRDIEKKAWIGPID